MGSVKKLTLRLSNLRDDADSAKICIRTAVRTVFGTKLKLAPVKCRRHQVITVVSCNTFQLSLKLFEGKSGVYRESISEYSGCLRAWQLLFLLGKRAWFLPEELAPSWS